MVAGHEKDSSQIMEIFKKHDADGNGKLSQAELVLVADELGTHLSKNELSTIYALLDQDKSGDITYKEFENWWLGKKSVDYSIL